MRSRLLALTTAPLVSLLALTALSAPAGAADDPVVDLTFDASAPQALGGVDLTNSGSGATEQTLLSSGGGALTSALGADGNTDAVRFPYFGGGLLTSPRAVIAVTSAGATDVLDPGDESFAYGAEFRLAGNNHGTEYDNGNNIVQRGLWNGGSQFKLQLDGGNAGCRVLGADGDLLVKTPVPTREWYSVTCSLTRGATADTLTISAAPVADDGTVGDVTSESVSGPVGALTYDAATPLTVGGKVTDALDIMNSSDQFNGRIDRAFFSIG